MTKQYPSRNDMVEELVESWMEANANDHEYLRDILSGSGIPGFGSMTDDEIKKEWDELQESYC